MITLTIIIPVFNEAKRIGVAFKAIEKFRVPEGVSIEEIIFVDDGSTDATKASIKIWQSHYWGKTRLISYTPNHGRGYALKRALAQVGTDYALYLDGDMAVPLENIKKLVPLMRAGADLVAGSKKKPGARCLESIDSVRALVGLGHSVVAWLILGLFYWDFQGGFKLFSRRLINQLVPLTTIDRWGFDMEVIFLAEKLGYQCREVPIDWCGYGQESKVSLLRDIFAALKDMVSIRLRWEKSRVVLPISYESIRYNAGI